VVLYGLALDGAKAGDKPPQDFGRRFAGETFGLPPKAARDVAEGLAIMHRVSPRLPAFKALTPESPLEKADVALPLAKIGEAAAALARARRYVKRHGRFYDDICFAADCLQELATTGPGLGLYRRAVKQWNRSRFADDPKRDGRGGAAHGDALVQRLLRGSEKQKRKPPA
jgi:hypothetical protein